MFLPRTEFHIDSQNVSFFFMRSETVGENDPQRVSLEGVMLKMWQFKCKYSFRMQDFCSTIQILQAKLLKIFFLILMGKGMR